MAFSNGRNNRRGISDLNIRFTGDNPLFITQSSVSKLLIQNQGGLEDKAKRIIDLNALEVTLKSDRMIKTAEVYMSVNGQITAEIEQKRPLARVLQGEFYIDDSGSWMPLSDNYSARVPLVTGIRDTSDLADVFVLARYVDADKFLKQHITEIHRDVHSEFTLRLRASDIRVELGDTSQLDRKFNNLKAFYQKAVKDDILESYSKLNLRFTSQVVCTKK
jgi:cell division protein FtsQ